MTSPRVSPVSIILLILCPSLALADDAAPAASATWLSVLPPLFAIGFALVTRKVIPALFMAVWLGAIVVRGFSPGSIWYGLLDSFQVYVLNAFADPDHAAVVLFSLMIGGMVGIISRNGGLQGIVEGIVVWADSARRACLATAAMGLAIFFDDYANTLVVGNTMRPVTDAKHISRAKLAYIVDSTAAPVACIALVTTWIGYEVGLIGDAVARIDGWNDQGYIVFLNTIPYSFYPILAIAMVFIIILSGRDFGPMLEAEKISRRHGVLAQKEISDGAAPDAEPIEPVEGKPHRAINAIVPVLVLILAVLGGLWVTGHSGLEMEDPRVRDVIGNSDSYTALMWASILSVVVAAVLTLSQRLMGLGEVVDAWYRGMRAMLYAMVILMLAWALGEITSELKTADYLVQVLGGTLPAHIVPAVVFLLAAFTAFATGTSWGVMGILTPLVIPLTWAILQSQGLGGPEHMHIMYSAIASVLAGAVWGDHCSPISDTTILSSMASGCDHIEHVRTQLPYALLVGGISMTAGSIAVAYGVPWYVGLLIGAGLLFAIVRMLGREAPNHFEPHEPGIVNRSN